MNYLSEVKTRLIWLFLGLALSLLIAKVITGFEETLAQNLILASFIPLITYMNDAVGTQMEAIIIRSISKSKQRFSFVHFFRQQLMVVGLVAPIIGVVAGAVVAFTQKSVELGVTIGLSLGIGIMSSLLTGALIPYLFWRLHEDPAEASGPVATVVQNLFSILIFLCIAQALL